MKLRLSYSLMVPAAVAVVALCSGSGGRGVSANETWNSSAAAHRMDARQNWWMNWPKARRDHDTACISCHTALPYALARPTMRGTLGEKAPSSTEQEMLGYVKKRVTLWDELEPYYGTKSGATKPVESRGTEPVLNALVLARYDLPTKTMSPLTEKAFGEMWAMQVKEGERKGAWEWLNFHLSPWEANESPYFGASLGAIAVGETPVSYKESPQIKGQLDLLRGYLKTNYDAQPLLNRVMYLWASSKNSGMMTAEQKATLLKELCERQAEDGGWSLPKLGTWTRLDKTEEDTHSDGYATGLIVYAMKQAGVSPKAPEMQRAVAWLVKNQNAEQGNWVALSLNKQRDPTTDPSQFMSDAASNYAVMALESVAH